MQSVNCRWQVQDNATFSFYAWGDECVVYNELSGHTHLLDHLAAEVLYSIKNRPASTEKLASQLHEKLDLSQTSDHSLNVYLKKILPELQRAELLESIST